MNVRIDSETIKYFLRKDHPLLCYIDDQCESIPSRGRFTSHESHDRQNSIVDSSWKSVNYYSRLVLRTNVEDAGQQVSNCAFCSNVFTLAIVPRYFLSSIPLTFFARSFAFPMCSMFRVPCQWNELKRIETRYATRGYLVSSVSTRVNQSAHEIYTQRIDNPLFCLSWKKFPLLFNLRSAILHEFYARVSAKILSPNQHFGSLT